MTGSTADVFEQLHPEFSRALISGEPVRMFAMKARFVMEKEKPAIEIAALLIKHGTKLQQDLSLQLCEVLNSHLTSIPSDSLTILHVMSNLFPQMVIVEINIFLRMEEDGSRTWTAIGSCQPAVMMVPGLSKAITQAGKEGLDMVTEALS